MTDWNKIALAIGALMLIAAAIIAFFRWRRAHASEAQEKKRIGKLLHSFAAPRGFKTLDNVTLVSGGLSGWADHIIIGHFGVLLVYDLCFAGSYYGKIEDEKWTLSVPNKGRYRIDNPLRTGAKCAGRVNTLLKDAGIRLSVDTAAVITVSSKDTLSYIKSDEVLPINQFRKYLKKAKFDQDKDVDVDSVMGILRKAQQ